MLDELFAYRVLANKLPGRCRLRIFPRKHKVIVIASELRQNPGMSITNAAEELATQVVRQYNLDPERIVWVEHYPDRGEDAITDETFDLVTFAWNGEAFVAPEWSGSSRTEIERLVGQPLDD